MTPAGDLAIQRIGLGKRKRPPKQIPEALLVVW